MTVITVALMACRNAACKMEQKFAFLKDNVDWDLEDCQIIRICSRISREAVSKRTQLHTSA